MVSIPFRGSAPPISSHKTFNVKTLVDDGLVTEMFRRKLRPCSLQTAPMPPGRDRPGSSRVMRCPTPWTQTPFRNCSKKGKILFFDVGLKPSFFTT